MKSVGLDTTKEEKDKQKEKKEYYEKIKKRY